MLVGASPSRELEHVVQEIFHSVTATKLGASNRSSPTDAKVSNSEGWDLPGLETLLTDPWWAEVLDMLAEAWPHKYVKVIENKLESFRARDGNTFLHLAAQQGHKPVFQLLRLFSESNQASGTDGGPASTSTGIRRPRNLA